MLMYVKIDGQWVFYSSVGGDGTSLSSSEAILLNEQLKTKIYYRSNVASMKSTKYKVGDYVKTTGYYEPNDGGSGEYKIVDGNHIEDGGFYHKLINGLYAELIIRNNTINVKQFGAKGDGDTDDTQSIQRAIDSYDTVFIPKGTYNVSKNNNLIRTDNSQPCLEINQKSSFKLYGENANLKVKVHGQGILEVLKSSNVIIDGIEFEGYGSFPAIQPNGRGEKGYYDTEYTWGKIKNNSTNTVGMTNIPSKFGNGYVGSASMGILVYDNSKNINIVNCKLHGFNYAGVSIGSIYINGNIEDIHVNNNTIYNCYDCGINLTKCKSVDVSHNIIYNIGHPDATITMENTNPGYGITSRKLGIANVPEDASNTVTISDNLIYNCVRKGVDAHNGFNFSITNNKIRDCWYDGISFTVPSQRAIIDSNLIENCGYKNTGICVRGGDNIIGDVDAIISNNILYKCGGFTENKSVIDTAYGNNINIFNNKIYGKNDNASSIATSIFVNYSNNINIKNNDIMLVGDYFRGIYIDNMATNVNVQGNSIVADTYNKQYIRFAANGGTVINNNIKYTRTDIPSGHAIEVSGASVDMVGANVAKNSNGDDLSIRYINHKNQIPFIDCSTSTAKLKYYKTSTITEYDLN